MLIDLHAHSTASDGTDAPAGVVEAAARAGLDVVALTDHDTTAGWSAAAAQAARSGVTVVLGTEISARWQGISVHLLSYLQDPAHPALITEMERTRAARLTRAREMVDLLAADFDLTWEDVMAHTGADATVGRPHIADALVTLGVVPDRSAAFATLLVPSSPYYVPHYAPDARDAVVAIRAAGGVPVFAHPGADQRGRTVPDAAVEQLAEAGLAGLEVHHRDHGPAQVARLTALAERLGLLVTGSSDYHGAGKPNLLGERTTERRVLDRIAEEGRTPVVLP